MVQPDCPEALRLQQSRSAMGSTFSIVLYGHDADQMEAAVDAAFSELRRLDETLSSYRPESEWSLVNREAALRPVAVSRESFQLISACLDYSRQTDGAFDITVGPLKRAWGFFRGAGSVPMVEALAAARAHVGYRFVQLDAESLTVRFDHPGVEIDPGGIGKGYAVDRMTEVLRRHGSNTALVAGSTSSLFGFGAPPGEPRGWRADIRDPEHPGRCMADLFLKNESLSTSGTGEQGFWSDGRMYAHIVDPRTGWPLQSVSQMSVVTPTALEGEVWAKACLLNGARWAGEHKRDGFGVLLHGTDPTRPPAWL